MLTILRAPLTALLALSVFTQVGSAGQSCSSVLSSNVRVQAETASEAQAFKHSPEAFELIAERIKSHEQQFIQILSEVDNFHGAKYEIEQVIKTLNGVRFHELEYLNQIKDVNNVAVYGSTNIPLYTLILHALIPASTGADVWFRTPLASRQVYAKLMAKIQDIVPELDLSKIHVLTEPSDVQYDNFRKQHVLGLNRRGKRPLRPPSEVVLFTGKPETGDAIAQQITDKLKEFPEISNKTVFLKFGSGLNPVVVTDLAGKQVDVAVEAAIQAVRINSSQDCIAPKFYAVHDKVSDQFVDKLKQQVGALKFGSLSDPNADYSPLTFSEDTESLEEFRTKWESYLVNGEANIDRSTKRVDPHVFVFPFEKFKDVELIDHFAPFIVVFTYNDNTELEELANDPRVRSRAMFASIFGDSSSSQMFHLRKLFEDNFHATILNQSIFVEESGNFAFGGYSPNASSATLILSENGQTQTYRFSRPILFSKEASTFFGENAAGSTLPILSSTSSEKQESVHDLLSYAGSIDTAMELGGDWPTLVEPQLELRPYGHGVIFETIEKDGLHLVVDKAPPKTEEERNDDYFLYGENLLYIDPNVDAAPKRVKGMVLHPTSIGSEVKTLNSYRGDLNPHLGWGFLHEILGNDKAAEYRMAQALWPGSMPRSKRISDLRAHPLFVELEGSKNHLLKIIEEFQQKQDVSLAEKNGLVDQVAKHVEILFRIANDVFPQGAFIKNFEESTTGDLGNQITSFSQNSRNHARQFVDRFLSVASRVDAPFLSSEFNNAMVAAFYETGTKMITRLLLDPNDILIQQRVKIAKTDLGFPTEIRVDFIDGSAINSRARYSHEYLGPERHEAEQVLNQFFASVPPEIRMLSGGADLVKLENGQWMFIEFNAGSSSGSIDAGTFPIDANVFLSRLQGRWTPLMQWLEGAFSQGISKQKQLLLSLKTEKEKWNKSSIKDLSIAEVARYYRDRYLDEWQKNPTPAAGAEVLTNLRTIFEGIGSPSNRDLPLLIQGAENFITHELLEQGESLPDNREDDAA